VQPFKIPTNSMWPTSNGMTSQVYKSTADEPNAAAIAARGVFFGAWPHRLDAPAAGEILIPIGGGFQRRGAAYSRIVPGKSWLVIPTQVREYTLLVGDKPVSVKLPMDFDFDWVIYDAFLGGDGHYSQDRLTEAITRKDAAREFEYRTINGQQVKCIRTGIQVRAGERVLSFDELTGDQLFVERVSYHFVRPSVGSGFVFRTGHIPDIANVAGDQYYIKRLVGTPGDTLEIKETTLYRNGQPATGSDAFAANAKREGRYPGYLAYGLLEPGRQLAVPKEKYFALGDNSHNSQDSRYWGFVPAKDVVGRPIFVYYPFTRHWGPAK
jgi:signal peptidase I